MIGEWNNGTGRRKSSVARVFLKKGSGQIVVNGKDMKDFFCTNEARMTVFGPMEATETVGKYDVFVNVLGGGTTGQAGATALGLGRALKGAEPQLEVALREAGFLTRDSRMKERKKYGLRGARRGWLHVHRPRAAGEPERDVRRPGRWRDAAGDHREGACACRLLARRQRPLGHLRPLRGRRLSRESAGYLFAWARAALPGLSRLRR